LKSNNPSFDIVVVGAGIAGLYLAYELEKAGQKVLLMESSDRVGGTWLSKAYQNSIYEFGPNTLMNHSEILLRLIHELGLENELLQSELKKSKRYLYQHSRLKEVPANPAAFLFSDILSLQSKLSIFLEPFSKPKSTNYEETVYEFISRKFSPEIATNLVGPALQGIWAGDIKRLSAKAALPKLYELDQCHGSIIKGLFQNKAKAKIPLASINFKQGLEFLCHKLADKITHIKLNCKIKNINCDLNNYQIVMDDEIIEAKKIVIATKAFQAADLIKNLDADLASQLNQIYYAPIALIAFTIKKNLFKETESKLFDAFGMISSQQAHFTLGTIFASQVFPERNLEDEYLFVSFVGGCKNSQILDFQSKDLWSICLTEHKEIFDQYAIKKLDFADFSFVDSTIIPKAIPQYNLGHQEIISTVEDHLAFLDNLFLVGNYLSGVSVPDTLKRCEEIKMDIMDRARSFV